MLKLGPLLVWLTGLVLVAAVGLGASAAPGEAQSSRHEIRATVMDEEGRLIDGLWVAATPTPYGVAPGEYQGRSTATGSVRFQLVAGAYSLALYTDQWGQCTVSGLENPEGRLKAAFVAEPGALVVLLGDFATGTEDRYRRNVEESQVFFAERYGVITSDVTFYFASDRESLVDTYRQVRGRDPASNLCADSTGNATFIATYRCFPVAHEYFHSIQQYLSGDSYRGSPTWIVEGSAVYTDFQRRYSRGTASYEEAYHFIWSSLGIELDSETAATMRASIANSIGYLAMEWLADEAGEAAIVDYFGALKSAEDWETAFERAFGLSVSEFYSRFEAYRLEVAPPFEWEIRGTVLDRDSQPLEGARVFAAAGVIGQRFSTLSTVTGSDGSFSISAGPGTGCVLLVRGHCPDGAFHDIGAQGEDGFTTDWRNAPPFTGEDRNRTGITITLPVTLAEFERDNCAS